ncbi:MAG: [FeFe] hydrogenase, group A [Collinsella sp.]|nr:[FeFe] hydrogenase, group A [Collinsella sp.]
MVKLTIDDRIVEVPEGTTILEAARSAGIEIPTLCHLAELNEVGGCRVCAVEVEGCEQLVASCNNQALDGMIVHTNSPRAREARRVNVQLLLSQHSSECTSCVRSGNCSLQKVSNDLGLFYLRYKKHLPHEEWDNDFPLIRDNDKCIKCMRCIQVCEKVQGIGVWDLTNRAAHTAVGTVGKRPITETDCVLCGQCITHCPTGALRERDDTERSFAAIADNRKVTLIQIAPAVRTAWGEQLGLTREEATVERLAACLRRIGFEYVFDTDFAADLTIMEEASELLERLSSGHGDGRPMFTSCCPGWVRHVKARWPQFIDCVSTSKSPQQMFGAIAKTYFAHQIGCDPHDIFSVSVMPCVAKKAECALPTMRDANGEDQDVDVVLTVREIVRMIRSLNIDPRTIDPEPLDSPLGFGTGAGAIFGATGGVMEAAVRSAYHFVTGENPDPDFFRDVRGLDGWKEAVADIQGTKVRLAVVSGLENANKLLAALEAGEVSYDFVEVMACPGGCVGGGGQPIQDGRELAGVRGDVLWGLDSSSEIRFSHENPDIKTCYREFLDKPLSPMAERLLHTDHTGWKMPAERG